MGRVRTRDLEIRKRALYRSCHTTSNKEDRRTNLQYQAVIPENMIPEILQLVHGHPTSGHFSAQRTISRAEDSVYWPFMHRDITDHCETCRSCEAFRKPMPSHQAPLKNISTSYPLQMVFADIAELPLTPSGHRYILVLVDHFSKHINLYAMKDQTAATVAKHIFEDFVREHGVPDTLHTDQGRQFESTLVNQSCAELGIKKTRSSPYHPQGAGIVERTNRVVKDQLAKTVTERGGCWDQYLKQVELAYNTAQHSSTGYTPFFLLHGREARLPYSLHNPTTSQNDTPLQYVLELRSRLRHAFQYAQSTNDLARTRQKETYDKKARDNEYQAGDLVWLDNPAMSRKKLEANWRGPYRILTSYSPEPLVRISNLADGKRSVVHKNRIKPYRSEVHQQQPHLPVFRGHDHPHFTALSGSLPPARGRPFIRRPGGSLPPSGGGVHGNRPAPREARPYHQGADLLPAAMATNPAARGTCLYHQGADHLATTNAAPRGARSCQLGTYLRLARSNLPWRSTTNLVTSYPGDLQICSHHQGVNLPLASVEATLPTDQLTGPWMTSYRLQG